MPEHHSISWSIQPNKKSINFGIFKHPGTKNGQTPALPAEEVVENNARDVPATPALDGAEKPPQAPRRLSVSEGESKVVDKLHNVGIKAVAWAGRCEADKVAMGRYDVPTGEGGAYGLVFDNTFSKQTSKNITLVLMTHPKNSPPKSGHHLHYTQAFGNNSANSVGKSNSPSLRPVNDSNDSLPTNLHRGILEDPRPNSKSGTESKGVEGTAFYTGILYKKRRKKGQGYAKRFFSLDFTSSTLSYYRNRHSSALRGAVPLALSAVGANQKTREFSVDSGAEVWHLKALNKKDFEGWRVALERAASGAFSAPTTPMNTLDGFISSRPQNPEENQEWARVEQLVSKVSGTRDAIRGLVKDTEPKHQIGTNGAGLGLTTSGSSSNNPSPTSHDCASQYFPEVDERGDSKRPFWKRLPSADRSPSALFRRSVSAQLAVPSPALTGGLSPVSPGAGQITVPKRPSMQNMKSQQSIHDTDVHERCMALLCDLDSVVSQFSQLISESKARRLPPLTTSNSRLSLDSVDSQEFFDADEGAGGSSQLLDIRRSSECERQGEEENLFDDRSEVDSDTSSDAGDGPAGSVTFTPKGRSAQSPLFPAKPEKLPPLPLARIKRRATVTGPRQPPPSIIGFLRKNAGKDLSTVSMPVTANEPTSLLQRLAETMEYPELLDAAAGAKTPAERTLYVAAFAVSYYSYNRVKERAVRKPFNPMLGETFELVREDLGFRFLAEKVSHHPVRMACQAESLNKGGWCYTQSPKPEQKFWGKSVELNNEGRARVVLYDSGEQFSWSQATCFLRNVIAGEKYVEPVQTMTVQNETSGLRAVVSFKAGGMFSGRSEDVTVQIFDGESALSLGLEGKWTDSLKRTDTGETIWKVGSLVPNAAKVYGFTTFAAALNEMTSIESGHLPPTDSRLRPDQQALEAGDVDKAEGLKARLEERQRARRKVLESHAQTWKPQFFQKVATADSEEEVWVLKDQDGYWDKRAAADWDGVQEVFEL